MSIAKKWIGKSVLRKEDKRLLTGSGRYVDDVRLPNTLHMAVLRSAHAHARFRLDISEALGMPGVKQIITAAELPAELNTLPVLYRVKGQKSTDFPVLPTQKAVYVGQALAIVVADSRYQAEDAVDAIRVSYEPLTVISDVEQAVAPDAPRIYEDWEDNIANRLEIQQGDVQGAFAVADLIIEDTFRIGRSSAIPMETRGIVAQYDKYNQMLSVWYSTQAPHQFRTEISKILGVGEHQIRVYTGDVGGGFGNKLHIFPEDLLVCWLSMKLDRPVKYIEDRREHLISTVHSRQQVHKVRAAFKRDGTLMALEDTILSDQGAHLHTKGSGPSFLTARMMSGSYRIPAISVEVLGVVTNKVPFGAYRGFGQPQAVFVLEQLMNRAADRLGMDRIEIRRRNLIGPDELPYRTATGMNYDSGDYTQALDRLLDTLSYTDLAVEKERAAEQGKRLGVGITFNVECGGFGPSRVLERMGQNQGGFETALVRMDPSGNVTAFTGIAVIGQGAETTLAQICADILDVDLNAVKVVHGDTELCPYSGYGSAGSRGATVGGAAMVKACEGLKQKILQIGASFLEVDPQDLELSGGNVQVKGFPERSVSLKKIAHAAYTTHGLPDGIEPGLEYRATYDPDDWTYAYSANLAVVELDEETGQVQVKRFVMVHDCGTALNPMIVEGQIAGGLAQGLGGALLEEIIYDANGQILSTTFMDYLLPSMSEMPNVEVHHMEHVSPFTPGGMKGIGEGGAIAAPATIVAAVEDALKDLNIEITQLPITPDRLRHAIRQATHSKN